MTMTENAGALSGGLDFHGQRVRSVMLDGEPWFSARDICDALEIVKADRAVAPLDAHMKRTLRKSDQSTSDEQRSTFFPGRVARHTVINEAGVHRLVMRSDKPSAIAFQNHLAEVVLPSIRKHGGYIAGQEALPEAEAVEIVRNAHRYVLNRREENAACFGPEIKRLFRSPRVLTAAQRRAMERRQAAQRPRKVTPRGPDDLF